MTVGAPLRNMRRPTLPPSLQLTGFKDLVRLDPRFEPYARTLFARPTRATDRDTLDAAAAASLDASLASFASLASPHLLDPATGRALEYLVRRFRIGEAVPDALVRAALPHHGTHAFVRILRVCDLEGTPWAWLAPAATAGTPVPRAELAARCVRDGAVLAAVAAAAAPSHGRPPTPAALSFYAVTVCEALAASPGLTDTTARALLPGVVLGLARGAGAHRRGAALVVGAALAAKAPLTDGIVTGEREIERRSVCVCVCVCALGMCRRQRRKKNSDETSRSRGGLPQITRFISVCIP